MSPRSATRPARPAFPISPTRVLTTPQGWWLIVVGCGVGFLFALVALCISVVSFPLMLDRHAGAGDAMVTSLRAVARNPVPMAAWGLIVAVLLVAGSLPAFLGLAVVIPLLGHATWHLYREVIEPEAQSAAASAPRASRSASLLPISRPICSPGGARTAQGLRRNPIDHTAGRTDRRCARSPLTNDELSIVQRKGIAGDDISLVLADLAANIRSWRRRLPSMASIVERTTR